MKNKVSSELDETIQNGINEGMKKKKKTLMIRKYIFETDVINWCILPTFLATFFILALQHTGNFFTSTCLCKNSFSPPSEFNSSAITV